MPIVAKSLDARAPGAATTIDSAAGRFSTQLHNSTVSTLVVTQRGSEVSPGQGVQATHGANALVQQVLSIKNGTYRDGYRLSSITLNDAIDSLTAQTLVDQCYQQAIAAACTSSGMSA